MPSYSASTEVSAPAEAVFARIADVASHGDWSADPLEIEPSGDGRFRSTARSKGKTITAEIAIVEKSSPERLVFDVTDMTGRWRHTFTLEPSAGGTRVTRRIAGSLSGAQLLLYWIVVLPIKKPNAAESLRRLKQTVEG